MKKEKFKDMLLRGDFASMVCEAVSGEVLSGPGQLFNVVKPYFAAKEDPYVEHFAVIFLDSKNRVLSMETMFSGSLDACSVYPREVLKRAFDLGAAAMLFAHNHPSGDCEPSKEDLEITRRLTVAAHMVGITVHDHIIVGADRFYDFATKGDMERIKRTM